MAFISILNVEGFQPRDVIGACAAVLDLNSDNDKFSLGELDSVREYLD